MGEAFRTSQGLYSFIARHGRQAVVDTLRAMARNALRDQAPALADQCAFLARRLSHADFVRVHEAEAALLSKLEARHERLAAVNEGLWTAHAEFSWVWQRVRRLAARPAEPMLEAMSDLLGCDWGAWGLQLPPDALRAVLDGFLADVEQAADVAPGQASFLARWHITPGGYLAFCELADEVPRFRRQADAIVKLCEKKSRLHGEIRTLGWERIDATGKVSACLNELVPMVDAIGIEALATALGSAGGEGAG